jgi:hypothetical protein
MYRIYLIFSAGLYSLNTALKNVIESGSLFGNVFSGATIDEKNVAILWRVLAVGGADVDFGKRQNVRRG